MSEKNFETSIKRGGTVFWCGLTDLIIQKWELNEFIYQNYFLYKIDITDFLEMID